MSSSWLRQSERDWLVGDWTVAEAFRCAPRPKQRKMTKGLYGRIVIKMTRLDEPNRVDWALAEAGFNAISPSELAQRWDEWVNYWYETQERPCRFGSPYTCDPAWALRAWLLGIPAEKYPKAAACALPERPRWPGNRKRIRAIMRLSRKLRSREPMWQLSGLKTAWLHRLGQLSGAFLRAAGETFVGRLAWASDDAARWDVLRETHDAWMKIQEVRQQLQEARVPARYWWQVLERPHLQATRSLVAEGRLDLVRNKGLNQIEVTLPGDARTRVRTCSQLLNSLKFRKDCCGTDVAILVSDESELVTQWWRPRRPTDQKLVERLVAQAGPELDAWATWMARVGQVAHEAQRQEHLRDRRRAARAWTDPLIKAQWERAWKASEGRRRRAGLIKELRPEVHALWTAAIRDAAKEEAECLASLYQRYDPEDGSIVGWRGWKLQSLDVLDNHVLTSPYQNTAWTGPALKAHDFPRTHVVRNIAGLHAEWTSRDLDMRLDVFGEVRGYGRVESGREGWRSEEMIIVSLYVVDPSRWSADVVSELGERYGVPVHAVDCAEDVKTLTAESVSPQLVAEALREARRRKQTESRGGRVRCI